MIAGYRIVKCDGEYIVKPFDGKGETLPEVCWYYTDDKQDAINTGKAMLKGE